jgi:hypothetical protein
MNTSTADNAVQWLFLQRRQKLSPLIDRINDRYGRCAIGFGLLLPTVRAFSGHAAFRRVPERWEF